MAEPREWVCQRDGCDEHGVQTTKAKLRKWCSERCRKIAMYARPCPECGTLMDGGNGHGDHAPRLCAQCRARELAAAAKWTADTIVAAITDYIAEHGRQPSASKWRTTDGGMHPSASVVQRVFGSWNAGLAAAGVVPHRVGCYGRLGEDPAVVAETIRLYVEEGLSARVVGEIMGLSQKGVLSRLERAGVPRRPSVRGASRESVPVA